MSSVDPILEAQRKRLKNLPASSQPTQQVSPYFGQNPFEPSSQIPYVPADPKLGEPLPSGRAIDPNVPSDVNAARMAQGNMLMTDTKRYLEQNASQAVNEQSLIDQGKSALQKIFDYQDEKDAQLFGINLAPVETVWDGFMRYFTGFYDLLNVGYGGLLSAMPGGMRTLSFDELTGGKNIGEVLSGEVDKESVPSPGQIFVASIGESAGRVRRGEMRLSDFLTIAGPTGMAALMAESSPLQEEGFNIMDKTQRDKAFESGWEKWMSGVTDFGLAFADPLIGAGVGVKVVRNGLLGMVGPAKVGARMGQYSSEGLSTISEAMGRGATGLQDEIEQFAAQTPVVKTSTVKDIYEGVVPAPVIRPATLDTTVNINEIQHPMGRVIAQIAQKDAVTGRKVLSEGQILQRLELQALPNKAEVASLLHRIESPAVIKLVLDDLHGTPGARELLERVAPAYADVTYRMRFSELATRRLADPQKVLDAKEGLQRVIENLTQMRGVLAERIPEQELGSGAAGATALKIATYDRSIGQAQELIRAIEDGRAIDRMDPQSSFFDQAYTDAVMADLHQQTDIVTQALNRNLSESAAQARAMFPMSNNPYARMVERSRERRARAGYQYAVEGTNWIPRKVVTTVDETADGFKKDTKWTWWSSSQFEGTSRVQRHARVWRWMGSATPSGFISLKGTSLVNQEREMAAVVDLDYLKQEPAVVTRMLRDENGAVILDEAGNARTETVFIGGIERRNQLMQMFTESLTDPTKDPLIAVMNIEQEIMKDFAAIYGLSSEQVTKLMGRANRGRDEVMDLIRQRGFFVDPVDGTRHYNAYLDSQLANGTYMHNFQFLEEIMRRESLRDGGKQFRDWIDSAGTFTGGIYDTFNSFWRPAVLMRLSYTQRNVFEGMVRAMAFHGSLAPLLWPVEATRRGVQTKIARKTAAKNVAIAKTALSTSDFMEIRRQADDAMLELRRWDSPITARRPDAQEGDPPGLFVWSSSRGQDISYVEVTQADIDAGRTAAQAAMDAAEARLEANIGKYEKAIEGTEFGKWRQEQIADLQKDVDQWDARQRQLEEFIGQVDADGNVIDLTDAMLVRGLIENANIANIAAARLKRMKYDPTAALAEYGNVAGRARRIGSGKSLAPDGNYYNNSFEGPYEQIARANMSSDATVMQGLSLHADVMGSLWRRLALRSNAAIPYVEAQPDEWINGMRGVIEANTSSALIREMVFKDYDLEEVFKWVTESSEGAAWAAQIIPLQAGQGATVSKINEVAQMYYGETSKRGKVEGADPSLRIKGQPKGSRATPVVSSVLTPEATRLYGVQNSAVLKQYLIETRDQLMDQMQRQPAFMELLRARAYEKAGMSTSELENLTPTSSGALTNDRVRIALDSIPLDQRQRLGFIQGSELLEMGAARPMRVWANFTSRVFRFLGTIPEDAVTRGPFYAGRYKSARDDMIEMYLIRTNQADKIRRGKKAAAPGGREHGGTIQHDEFTIPAGEMRRIEFRAHERALLDTREWMYTIERRTKLGKYGEWVFPFISATQNSATVAGKLLYRQPWLAPFIYDVWRAPSRAGFEDEQGNLMLPVPLPWVREFLKDKPYIPGVGGVLADTDMLTIPKEALNLWTPETGFGVVPRPAAWAQVAASELMKANMFPVETPQIIRNAMGEKNGDEFYTSFKQWIFGEQGGASSKVLSWDKLFPAYAQKAIYSKDELSAQYGYQFSLQWATQMYRWRNGDRSEPPTESEINQRTTNGLWFQAMGNWGLPTPLTPYPILSRPLVKSPIEAIQDQYRLYQQVDPKTASVNFYNDYGDLALMAANTKITRNIGGIDPVPESVSDAQTLAPLISNVANNVSNLEILGLLVNNRSSNVTYEDSAYEWQKTARIAGTNQEWRQVQAPAQSVAERQRIAGWVEFRQFMDQLDAQLAAAGLPNYQVAAAKPYLNAKEVFMNNMFNNPDRDGWTRDYKQMGVPKATDAVRAMSMAVEDEGFVKLIGGHDPLLLSNMQQYLYYRALTKLTVDESGKPFTAPENAAVRDAWLTIRQDLSAHPRFGEIMSLYLYGDENPVDIGPVGTNRLVEVGNG